MGTLQQDLKYGFRMHTRNTSFTLIAVLTLALGIGASTAVFSVVDAILLKPLPYRNVQSIVFPWRLAPAGNSLGFDRIPWNQRSFKLFTSEAKSFQEMGAFKGDSFNFTGAGDPALLEGLRASAGFFPTLGVTPLLGRTYSAEEDSPGHELVVVLSYQLWQERFGGDDGILNRSLDLNGRSYKVIGVMPAGFVFPHGEEMPGGFNFPRQSQLWVPLALPDAPLPNAASELAVIGRLQPGVTVDQAQQEMNVLAKTLEVEFPGLKGWFNSVVTPLTSQVAGDTRRPLLLMLGAVGVVLLIACSNVANLLLARSLGRKAEFTLRSALGAGQSRLVRQLLTESLVLALAAGLVGLLFAFEGVRFVKAYGPSNIPRLQEVGLDPEVFLFTLATTVITGILFGLAPAFGATRKNLAESLNETGIRPGGNSTAPRIRRFLLVSETALALVLVVAAALLTQTFFRMLRTNGGFNAERVLAFQLSLPAAKYSEDKTVVSLYQRALQQFKSIPGVESSGLVYVVPMAGATEASLIRLPDRPTNDHQEKPFANYTITSPGYFSSVGTPLQRGRDFLESDTADSVPVVIINNAMAKEFWPNQDPIGRQVGLASTRFPLMTVVGIVADVKHVSLREVPGPEMYVPYTQKVFPSLLQMHVVMRTKADPTSVTSSVRDALRTVDPEIPMAKVTTLATLVDNTMAQPRFAMLLLGSFGILAVLLASVGMYGVLSYSVAQRTREIGIRMALGAQRSDVLRMVLRQGIGLAGVGIVIGVVVALGVTRLMTSFLYGVEAADLATYIGVCILLMLVAGLSCYLPARRATRVDPLVALRYE